MIPGGITKAQISRAIAEIDRNGIPDERKSVHYDLVVSGIRYPPKYTISIANRYLTGKALPPDTFNAVEARDFFLKRGYQVIDRRAEALSILAQEESESTFPEGVAIYKVHRKLERDTKISKMAKADRLAKANCLKCDVCSFDFLEFYGQVGKGFIEAHHTKPVSTLNGEEKTKVSDLALVCSNCHRMLHMSTPPLTVAQLKAHVAHAKA